MKKLRERVETGGLKDPQKIQRAIGRTLQKNPRVARYYAVELTGTDTDRTVQWSRSSSKFTRYSGSNIAVCHNQT